MLGRSFNLGFGVERDPQSGFLQHGQVVGAVAHGDHLLQMDVFLEGQQFQQLGFPLSIHDLMKVFPGKFPVFDLQFVGKNVVEPQLGFQVISEVGESPGKDGGAVAVLFQRAQQAFGASGNGQVFGNFFHHRFVQSFQQRNPFFKTFLKIDLAPHGAFGDLFHLIAYAGPLRQLVDHLGLDQRGVHVETYQTPAAAVDVVFLKSNVDARFGGDVHESLLHGVQICGISPYRKFYHGVGDFVVPV